MNRKDLQKVKYIAENTNFGNQFAELAGILADRVHEHGKWGSVEADAMSTAALFKWQAIQLNGEWDLRALEECFEWLKKWLVIVDLDEKLEEVKEMIKIKSSRGQEARFDLEPKPADSRFKNLEL